MIIICIICLYFIIGIITSFYIMKSYSNGKSLLHESNIPYLDKYNYNSSDDLDLSREDEAIFWGVFWPIFWIALIIKYVLTLIIVFLEHIKYRLSNIK